jgi:cell wall-associated NlpC family hydrolase
MQMRRAEGLSRRRIGVRAGVALAGLTASVATLGAAAVPASAAPPGPHDPFGSVTSVTAVTGGLRFNGWAVDPDARTANATVVVVVDGRVNAATASTSVANASVTSKYHTGPTPGFSVTTPIATGAHTACLVAQNSGAGLNTILKCATTPLTTRLTATQLAAHNPKGAITSATANATSIRVRGWASDPDFVSRRATVVLYVDGRSAATVISSSYPAPRPAAAGYLSAYDITVPVSTGMHLGCIWIVNVGLGSNAFQGCKALDTRGAAGTGTVTVPTRNKQVLAEAKTHIGQRYVWGATGPSTFDCSGLVLYSYKKYGYVPPRVSEDQAVKARLIPASRAVPGDLVFTHDSVGDVYHVGLYVSPGKALAAIDENSGVNYQSIWDPSATTYGSFTHS